MTPFDKESIYDNELSPLVAQIIEICKRENMPLLLSVNYRVEDESEDSFCTSFVPGNGALSEAYRIIRSGARSAAFAFTITQS